MQRTSTIICPLLAAGPQRSSLSIHLQACACLRHFWLEMLTYTFPATSIPGFPTKTKVNVPFLWPTHSYGSGSRACFEALAASLATSLRSRDSSKMFPVPSVYVPHLSRFICKQLGCVQKSKILHPLVMSIMRSCSPPFKLGHSMSHSNGRIDS